MKTKLLVLVGETASGKSGLALHLAKKLNGEIICADSRTIYKKMDVGTAKPTSEEQAEVKHYLLDVVMPDQDYNVARFQTDANEAINEIGAKKKLPILVGGTGLYIDSVIFDYEFQGANKDKTLRDRTLVVGLKPNRTQLRKHIEARVEAMFRRGLRKEVDELVEKYGWEHEALTGIGYREFKAFYQGEKSMTKVKQDIVKNTLQLAKRQRTWFKRNLYINWFETSEEAEEFVLNNLNR